MSHPLSIGSAVVGLMAAAGRITLDLHQFINAVKYAPKSAQAVFTEVKDITAALAQLQSYLAGLGQAKPARKPLLSMENIIVTVTGCLTTYSELEVITKKCFDKQPMGVFTRLEWLLREMDVNKIINRLQNHKSSLILMLTILQCETLDEAQTAVRRLCTLVDTLLQSNTHLHDRLASIESTQVTGRASLSIHDSHRNRFSSASLGLEISTLNDALKRSRVYKRTWDRRGSVLTATSSKRGSLALSAFSDLSLGNVSVVSVFCLPIWSSDLSNSEHYDFGSGRILDANTRSSFNHLDTVSEATENVGLEPPTPKPAPETMPDLQFWFPNVAYDEFAVESTAVYGLPPTRPLPALPNS